MPHPSQITGGACFSSMPHSFAAALQARHLQALGTALPGLADRRGEPQTHANCMGAISTARGAETEALWNVSFAGEGKTMGPCTLACPASIPPAPASTQSRKFSFPSLTRWRAHKQTRITGALYQYFAVCPRFYLAAFEFASVHQSRICSTRRSRRRCWSVTSPGDRVGKDRASGRLCQPLLDRGRPPHPAVFHEVSRAEHPFQQT